MTLPLRCITVSLPFCLPLFYVTISLLALARADCPDPSTQSSASTLDTSRVLVLLFVTADHLSARHSSASAKTRLSARPINAAYRHYDLSGVVSLDYMPFSQAVEWTSRDRMHNV